MHKELYTDGVDEITISGTIVRVDLVSLSPTERDANNVPKKVFTQRLIFSAEAFANSVDVMQNALRGLVDAGVVTRNQPRAVPSPSVSSMPNNRSATAPETSSQAPNVSTNFR